MSLERINENMKNLDIESSDDEILFDNFDQWKLIRNIN